MVEKLISNTSYKFYKINQFAELRTPMSIHPHTLDLIQTFGKKAQINPDVTVV